jgi:hypothetical protein
MKNMWIDIQLWWDSLSSELREVLKMTIFVFIIIILLSSLLLSLLNNE